MNKKGKKIPVDAFQPNRLSKHHASLMEGIMTCCYFWLKVWESPEKYTMKIVKAWILQASWPAFHLCCSVGSEHSPRLCCGEKQILGWIWSQVLWTPNLSQTFGGGFPKSLVYSGSLCTSTVWACSVEGVTARDGGIPCDARRLQVQP